MASASPLAVTGDRDRPPVRMSLPQAFSFGGAAAAGAVLVALFERERSGLGQHVDVSAQQAAALATQAGLLAEAVGAPASIRSAGGATMGGDQPPLPLPGRRTATCRSPTSSARWAVPPRPG